MARDAHRRCLGRCEDVDRRFGQSAEWKLAVREHSDEASGADQETTARSRSVVVAVPSGVDPIVVRSAWPSGAKPRVIAEADDLPCPAL